MPSAARAIELHTPAVVRGYAADLAERLKKAGHRVRFSASPHAGLPGTVDWMLMFERKAYHGDCASFAKLSNVALKPGFEGEPDLVIDLAGDAAQGAAPILGIRFDFGDGECGLIAALLEDAAPAFALLLSSQGQPRRIVSKGRFAVEQPHALALALRQILPRMNTLLLQAASHDFAEFEREADMSGTSPASLASVAPVQFAAAAFAGKIASRLTSLVRYPDHWYVALRDVHGDATMDRLDWPRDGHWRRLPEDNLRYFADPFLFAREGRRFLFVEELPYATGVGILSVAELDANGIPGPVRPIIDSGSHLSWPQVFEHEGAIYMIPESAAAGRVELWRAENFPGKWVLDRVLIDNVRAHDPLICFGADGISILATLDDDGGSSWDALGLFTAPGLFGPWTAHKGNPLLVDAGMARGAGPVIQRADGLWRATQDCRDGYGRGLAICKMSAPGPAGFSQRLAKRLGPPPGTGAHRIHTLTALDGIEAIDLCESIWKKRARAADA